MRCQRQTHRFNAIHHLRREPPPHVGRPRVAGPRTHPVLRPFRTVPPRQSWQHCPCNISAAGEPYAPLVPPQLSHPSAKERICGHASHHRNGGHALALSRSPQPLYQRPHQCFAVRRSNIRSPLSPLLLTQVSEQVVQRSLYSLSLIHISEPTRLRRISYAVFCLKKKKRKK